MQSLHSLNVYAVWWRDSQSTPDGHIRDSAIKRGLVMAESEQQARGLWQSKHPRRKISSITEMPAQSGIIAD
jgi:hypothetical protein